MQGNVGKLFREFGLTIASATLLSLLVSFTLVPMLGDTVVPSLLGGGNVVMISATVQSLVTAFQYPLVAATAVLITGTVVILLALLLRVGSLRGGFAAVRR